MRHKLKFFTQIDPDNAQDLSQYLDFAEREPRGDYKELVTTRNGTTVREVLKACQRELEILDEAIPCYENQEAIFSIVQAIFNLDQREVDRKHRGVEGYHLP